LNGSSSPPHQSKPTSQSRSPTNSNLPTGPPMAEQDSARLAAVSLSDFGSSTQQHSSGNISPLSPPTVILSIIGLVARHGNEAAERAMRSTKMRDFLMCALTPKLSRDAQWSEAHGKLYLPCALRNEAASA